MRFASLFRAVSLFLLLCAVVPAYARPALVVNAANGEVLHSHEATRLWYPASVTKVMTTYVALSAVRDGKLSMDSQLTVSARALAEPPSKTGMPVGSTLSLEKALRILMVKSANDTSVTVAEGVSGSVEAFVAEMNNTAKRLGMRDTRYANPNGLPDPSQITTARDQAILAMALYRDFSRYSYLFRLQDVKIGKRTFRNHNSLMRHYPGTGGVLTGFICDSGFNLVASARRSGKHLIGVVFGAESVAVRRETMMAMLEDSFEKRAGGLFRTRRAKVDALPSTGKSPEVMRPYVCGPRKKRQAVPARVASYGLSQRAYARLQSGNLESGSGDTAIIQTDRTRSGGVVMANAGSEAKPEQRTAVKINDVPMPSPNPLR